MARGRSKLLWGKGTFLLPGMMTEWAGMGMDGSAVAGNRKVSGGTDTTPDGRDDSDKVKKLLEKGLKVEREILPVQKPFHDLFGDFFRRFLWAFWCFPFGLSGFLEFNEAGNSLRRE